MKIKKIIAMGLAAIMAISAMSISAFAAETLPTLDEVDTSLASADHPVEYATEDGIKVRLYDPNISVEFVEQEADAIFTNVAVTNAAKSVYIPKATSDGVGTKTASFKADADKIVKFGLTTWEGGPKYNVALYSSSGSCLFVAEDVPKANEATLSSTPNTGYYYFRVSTYYTPGNAYYYTYTV